MRLIEDIRAVIPDFDLLACDRISELTILEVAEGLSIDCRLEWMGSHAIYVRFCHATNIRANFGGGKMYLGEAFISVQENGSGYVFHDELVHFAWGFEDAFLLRIVQK